jgi:hypothetical protein
MGNPKQSAENSKKPRGKPFQPGKTGNAGGRPKLPEDVKHVRELARNYTAQAVEALVSVLGSSSDSARVSAASVLLDRGWGKAEQPIVGDPEKPLEVISTLRPQLTKEEWMKAHGVGATARPAG